MAHLGAFFSFTGRVGRATYWLGRLPMTAGLLVGLDRLPLLDPSTLTIDPATLLGLGAVLLAGWIATATTVARWHDLDRSGLWVAIEAVPLLGIAASLLILGTTRGTPGDNRWGPPPDTIGPLRALASPVLPATELDERAAAAVVARWTAETASRAPSPGRLGAVSSAPTLAPARAEFGRRGRS